jgi:tetratricopeptide (TPR) repeat protein
MNEKLTESIEEQTERITREIDWFIESYNDVLARTPIPAGFAQRAAAQFDRGNYEDAVADFSESLRLDAEDNPTLLARGIVYKESGEYEAAISDLENIVQTSEEHARARRNLLSANVTRQLVATSRPFRHSQNAFKGTTKTYLLCLSGVNRSSS